MSGMQAHESMPASDQAVGRRPRVVVAEDEALIRLDLVEMLADAGYEVVGEAGDGVRAVELARSLAPDLVILDVKMPLLDGVSAAERIAAEDGPAVVLLTAFSQRALIERATDAGAMAYLVKPFSQADLIPAIEVALSRHAQVRTLRAEVASLSEALEARKLVERAKSRLMEKYALSESEAFRWIQRAAMDRRMSMREVADVVLTDESLEP